MNDHPIITWHQRQPVPQYHDDALTLYPIQYHISYIRWHLWPLPQKHGYRPKQEFYRRGFLKFGCLVLAPNVLVGSENWLLCLSYNQESILNVVYFFWNFSELGYEGDTVSDNASAPCLNVATKKWLSSKNKFFHQFHLDTSRMIL